VGGVWGAGWGFGWGFGGGGGWAADGKAKTVNNAGRAAVLVGLVPSVSARCSVQNWPIGRTPVDAPAGRTVRVCSVRLVSFTHRPVAAICYEVEPVDGPARITVQSELTANEQLPPAGADPRVAAALEDPLRGEYHDATGTAVVLVHKTRRSGLRVGAAMDHLVDCPAPVRAESRFADGGLVTAATVLAPGQKLRVIKFGG